MRFKLLAMTTECEHGSHAGQTPRATAALHAMDNQLVDIAFDSAEAGRVVIPTRLQIEETLLVVLEIGQEFLKMFFLFAFCLLDIFFEFVTHDGQTVLAQLVECPFGEDPVLESSFGSAVQMKAIQYKLLADGKAVKAVPYPLVSIPTADQKMGLAEVVMKMGFTQDLLLPCL